ncbi:sugar phosphate isomerase/epimerase family protein [Lederbergia wuyishanensis]|uniref:Sugar phosphate isomerase/epimerase n=1 Tax=Lederbergia wuyishanensis TaxID=1347903 RepID=A0ABU0D5S8_9BACI|nr:sugar phosphate isomerase/epimerase [Lederbergia wuyishanensis]MCJ8008351.1 sugar phosphate isomerase/epimerase [Lederbergia wuyishanensis]MDQ0343763.1 sugar phosphate isomerase/epimerase [Lederbergia wuyishanensis]
MVKVGIQLYSVRNSIKAEPFKTLEKIAQAGYKYVEAANHNALEDDGVGFGLSATEMKNALDDLGLSIIGCHINPLNFERLPAVLDYHQELGNKQIGCDIEFFPYEDLDYLKFRCELFNQVGEMCKDRGMRYYYHNHFQEFQRFGEKTVYDLIMEHTDPKLVFIEMDTYWIMRGGQDPLKLIEKYRDRLILLHQKDFPKNAPQPVNMFDGIINDNETISFPLFEETKDPHCFTEIGTGIMPIQDIIIAASKAPNLEYIILEQDHTDLDEIDSINVSMEAFKRYSGTDWE